MITLEIIEREEPAAAWLEAFKAYASVADNSQDSLLATMLVRACMRVQEMADRSILACTLELHDDEVEDHRVRLFQTVSEVVSVTSAEGHRQYWEQEDRTLRVYRPSRDPPTWRTSSRWCISTRPPSMMERTARHSHKS